MEREKAENLLSAYDSAVRVSYFAHSKAFCGGTESVTEADNARDKLRGMVLEAMSDKGKVFRDGNPAAEQLRREHG